MRVRLDQFNPSDQAQFRELSDPNRPTEHVAFGDGSTYSRYVNDDYEFVVLYDKTEGKPYMVTTYWVRPR